VEFWDGKGHGVVGDIIMVNIYEQVHLSLRVNGNCYDALGCARISRSSSVSVDIGDILPPKE
jgi:hypothetical protein